jgi:hypothetical protein
MCSDVDYDPDAAEAGAKPAYLSAKASHPDGTALTAEEIEAAEAEAEAWARRVNCC